MENNHYHHKGRYPKNYDLTRLRKLNKDEKLEFYQNKMSCIDKRINIRIVEKERIKKLIDRLLNEA
jgi:hypothetical protein